MSLLIAGKRVDGVIQGVWDYSGSESCEREGRYVYFRTSKPFPIHIILDELYTDA